MMSYALITGMGELASVIGAVNFTRYMSNELLEKLKDILIAFGMIEPEIMADGTERKPFYGGGAPGALHFLPMADMIKVINAGVAAQYWKHFVDPDTYLGQTLGFQNMDPMTNEDFGMEMLGLASVEGGRLVRSTIPAYRKSGIMSAAIAELGLYGGRTNILDIDTKDYTFDKLMGIEKSKLSSRQRGKALGSLDYLST